MSSCLCVWYLCVCVCVAGCMVDLPCEDIRDQVSAEVRVNEACPQTLPCQAMDTRYLSARVLKLNPSTLFLETRSSVRSPLSSCRVVFIFKPRFLGKPERLRRR